MAFARPILVVEDNDELRESIVAVLRDHGYDILEAANGAQGLQVLRSRTDVGLIVLDLMMPLMNGATFRWEQRWDPAISTIPVLVLSSVRDGSKSAEVLAADGYLRKPFEAAELFAVVDRLCLRPREPRDSTANG